ncbi:MAG: peptidylprolyl isomerase [Methylococcaceae bacterium]|jgi:peptidyl-prolyl cis-trans isomerase C
MKKNIISLLIAGAVVVTACEQSTPPATTAAMPTVDKADAIASVNGQYISKASLTELEKEVSERTGQNFPKEKLIDELVQRELLIQDAKQKQLDKTPEFMARIETLKNSLLSQTSLQNFIKANPVTDEEIKAEYDSKVGAEKGQEYKARHILVKTEDEAKKLIAQLDKGAKFEELATKHSTDTSAQGGDLGWFSPSQMVAPFSEAVAALENGKYSKTPIQTQFGWHIILREDSRASTPPPFEAVKEQISPYLQRKKIQTMLDGLRKQAQVEVLVPLTEEPAKVEATPATDSEMPAKEGAETGSAEDAAANIKEKATEAAKSVENGASEAVKTMTETTEKAAEKTEEAAKEMADKVEKAVDKTGEAMKEAMPADHK